MTEIKDIQIKGSRGVLNALVVNASEPVTIRSPMSFDRAYDIQVSVIGAYNIRCLFPPDQIPEADFVWNPQDGNTSEVAVVPEFSLVLLPILTAAAIGTGMIYNKTRKQPKT